MAQKRQHPTSPAPTTTKKLSQDNSTTSESPQRTENVRLFESLPIHDLGSVFIAIFSDSPIYINNPKLLQAHEPFQDAMHRILAYRRESKQQSLSFQSTSKPKTVPTSTTETRTGSSAPVSAPAPASTPTPTKFNIKPIYATGSDEDGEKYAGKKLERLLQDLDVEGVVVVARWYGGILLGPVRFDHITNAAKEAIGKWREDSDGQRPTKRSRTEQHNGSTSSIIHHDDGEKGVVTDDDDIKDKERLVRVLVERDASVDVLRGLLAEKGGELKKLENFSLTRRNGHEDQNLQDQIVRQDESSKDSESTAETRQGNKKLQGQEGAVATSMIELSSSTDLESTFGIRGKFNLSQGQDSSPSSSADKSSPVKPNYKDMSITKLKQLEKARDATLKWILKQIDVTEVKIKEAERKVEQLRASQTG